MGLSRAQAEVVAAFAMALLLALMVAVALRFLALYRQASSQLAERGREVLQALLTGGVRGYVDLDTGTVYLASGVPLRVYARYVQNFTHVLWGEASQTPIMTVGDQYVPVYQGPLTGLVYRGEAQVVLVTDRGLVKWDPVSEGGGAGEGIDEGLIGSISRLYPLLATYLRPEDYIAVTDQYVLVNVSVFTLRSYYYSTQSFVYVRVSWNSTHYVVTFRKHSSSGALLGTHYATIPSSDTMVTVPYREWLYDSSCEVRNGIRYCFEVYVTAQGWCSGRCSSPRDSLWYFAVGMRVVYRFEPVEPGYYLLVVLNRTTYEGSFGKGVATCTSYTSYGGGCVTCSTSPYVGYCNVDTSTILNVLGGPRPVFWWEVGYPQYLESSYGDDGYEEGAWYPYTSAPSFSVSHNYAYTTGGAVTVAFYLSGVRGRDYLRQLSNYQEGSYRVAFKLVYDEGGLGADAKVWDYRVVVFLMKPRGGR